jgi:hypothetical protein
MQVMARRSRLLQRCDLSVIKVVIEMRAFTKNGVRLGPQKNAANGRVGRCEGGRLSGEF